MLGVQLLCTEPFLCSGLWAVGDTHVGKRASTQASGSNWWLCSDVLCWALGNTGSTLDKVG